MRCICWSTGAVGASSFRRVACRSKHVQLCVDACPHNSPNKVLSRCCLELRQQVIPTACVTQQSRAFLLSQDGIILVYDICDRESFNHVDEWLNEVNRRSVAHLRIPFGHALGVFLARLCQREHLQDPHRQQVRYDCRKAGLHRGGKEESRRAALRLLERCFRRTHTLTCSLCFFRC